MENKYILKKAKRCWYFEKINKIYKILVRVIMHGEKKEKGKKITNIRNTK